MITIKKIPILFIFALLITLSPTGISAADSFSDINGHWAENYINYIQAKGYINGYGDGTFRPDGRITRAEFVTILAKMNDYYSVDSDSAAPFTDVSSDHWAYNYIQWAYKNHIVAGYKDNTFRPSAYISRAEIAVLICRYITDYKQYQPLSVTKKTVFADDSEISSWAKDAVYTMQASGILNGRGNQQFQPTATATRGETAKIITVYLQYYESAENHTANTISITYNGTLKATQVPTLSENGHTLIAARPFFEAAGFQVNYYNITKFIAVYHDSKDIEFYIGKNLIFANGIKYMLPVSTCIKNGITYIPLNMAAFAAGLDTEYDESNQILNLKGSQSLITNTSNQFYGSVSGTAVSGNIFISHGNKTGFWGKINNSQMTYGSYASGNGDLFCGQWQDGVLNGSARSVTMNGEFFYGTYSNGNPEAGVHYYTDGSVFEGTFQTGTNGAVYPQKGCYTDADGNTYGNNTTVWNGGSLSKNNW